MRATCGFLFQSDCVMVTVSQSGKNRCNCEKKRLTEEKKKIRFDFI